MQHLQPSTTLQGGKYRIERVLGQGGFGITYMAIQVSANCQVAIKELFLNGVNERAGNSIRVSNSVNDSLFEKQKEKFKKEAKRIMSLDNEHIVKVYDLFEENNTVYYVMDYVDGETLYDLMKRNDSPMTELEVKRLLPQILDALKSIHNASILYLDLKPMNIMINKSGKMILVDFEASKQFNLNNFSKVDEEEMSYTPYYSPREQIELDLDNIGPWSDIYALGATLFNLLTNKRPPSPSDIDSDESDDKHVSLPLFNISRGMKHFILLMMKTNWTQRPQTIDELSLMMQNELYGIDNQNKNMQQLQTGTTLQGGKYRIERVLGQGGFGITYLATQLSLLRQIAIKEFFMKDFCTRDETTQTLKAPTIGISKQVEQYRKKFIKEARNLARLKHPHIINVIDVFEENDTVYYVMPYLSGGSLQDYVKKHGILSEKEAMKYIEQIASALKYMHEEEHICHYDVKPANILLDEKGNAVLIDFGISKNYDAAGQETTTTPIGMSDGYAPIEQYSNMVEFSPASDVYALGATLYYLLHGKRPVKATDRVGGVALLMRTQLSHGIKDIINASMKLSKIERAKSVDVFMGDVNTSVYQENYNIQDDDESTIIEGYQRTEKTNTTYSQPYENSKVASSATQNDKNSYIGWIIGIAIVAIIGFFIYNKEGNPPIDNSNITAPVAVQQEISNSEGEKTDLVVEPRNKLSEAIEMANTTGTYLYSNNAQVFYLKDKMPASGFDNTPSGCAHIYVYDVNSETTKKVDIRLPSGDDGLQYEIDSYAITNNKITFIMCERGRNGFGVNNFTTEVAQYNTQTNRWRNIADGCAGAEFIEANKKILLKFAEIINYEEAESAAEYKYEYTYQEINL